ncbi:MAG: tRNA lysidine(34) synthetase TilS [Meiothermus sp.]|uniref:tRNA lysidine(34) synthetase TilS n=1 Tax=Meiothermus sp. TaxID=1955249 RepID=UPI0025E74559|nr:tRNA lysidine(34) synthetase TilS [Meiothermus sp.]MCS7067455.1 tRNA lysidine(34) synthetase TilS [Meiothermus sp.]MCX7600516.1 tRNA lysidine(34) synthetase TilS [Meiothermus sp.]MDW8425405.1 tRNA lysidine(34) synthetase TilS [Meiothermus sp.]
MDSVDVSWLEAQFANHLTRLVPEGSLVAAVSGGGDSVALLLLLTSTPRKVVVAHLDHSLREGSAADALWVRSLAERLGYPFESEKLNVAQIAGERGENLEATARDLRYGFLAKVAKKHGAQAILTAHTEDDQAETVLLQLLQGTGRGLGMRPRRGKVVRPLLEVSRSTLRAYLRSKNQDWLEDISNADTSMDRNFLRHEIVPRLKDRFPQTNASLSRFAAISQLDDEALDPLAAQLLLRDRRWPCPAFRVAPLLQAPAGLRRRALRQMLEQVQLRPEAGWITQLERALQGEAFTLPEGWQVRRRDGTLFLIPPVVDAFPPWRGSRLPKPGDQIDLPEGRVRLVDFFTEHSVPTELKQVWPVRAVEEVVQEVWNLWPESDDLEHMRTALEQARRALEQGEVPIGAVVVWDGLELATAHNLVEQSQDATAHAELLALQKALLKRQAKVLPGATVYVTLEPCPMCFGALVEAQVRRVVYAVENLKAGAVTVHRLRPPFEWEGGWLERDSARLLRGFFAQKRASK